MYNISAHHTRTECPNKDNFRLHTHNYYEIYCFIHGDAEYSVEGNVYKLKKGDIIITRKSEFHTLVLRSDIYYERYVISFDLPHMNDNDELLKMFNERPLGQYNCYKASLFPGKLWMYYIEKIKEYSSDETKQLIYLMPLLNELSAEFITVKLSAAVTIISDKSYDIITYINNHLFENLSLEMICERFFISKSQLNRIFKKATGTSVWNYITVKRLMKAKEMLRHGEKPTAVCNHCGFNDYASFFRAYRNRFGCSPKQDIINK